MNSELFHRIKQRYGRSSSFAVWSCADADNSQGVDDLSLFDINNSTETLESLKTEYILLGLNISRSVIASDFANFHDGRRYSKDYKLRFALRGSPLWGSYMTDVFKDIEMVDSADFERYMRAHPEIEKAQIEELRAEISEVTGQTTPKLFGLGSAATKYLRKHFSNDFEVYQLMHYSHYVSKENYRESVCRQIEQAISPK